MNFEIFNIRAGASDGAEAADAADRYANREPDRVEGATTVQQLPVLTSLLRLMTPRGALPRSSAAGPSASTLLCAIEKTDDGRVLVFDLETPAPGAAAEHAPSIVGQLGWKGGLRLALARLLAAHGGGSLDAVFACRSDVPLLRVRIRFPLAVPRPI